MAGSGIYQIRNLINNHIYIGSAKRLIARKITHFNSLEYQKHHSKYLQRAYNKYGKENFVFEVLITCDPSLLIWYEQQFLDQYKPEYNISKIAGSNFGVRPSKETKEKNRRAQLGKKHSEEEKRKISISHVGILQSKESREKISIAHRKPLKHLLISPNETICSVTNRKEFCKEYDLLLTGISSLDNNIFLKYKGWKIFKEKD